MDRLILRAEAMGLRVVFRDLGRRSGELHSSGLIYINHRKSELTQRMTLAHECGHAALKHDWSEHHDRAKDERAADIYAANMLISIDDYRRAEHLVGPHPGAMAKELGVSRRLVELRRGGLWRDERVLRVADEFYWA